MFKIGENVVCIKPVLRLIKGEIYTIQGFQNDFPPSIGIYVEELNEPHFFYGKWSYNINRFRKLDYEFADNILEEITEAMKSKTILN